MTSGSTGPEDMAILGVKVLSFKAQDPENLTELNGETDRATVICKSHNLQYEISSLLFSS